MVIRLPPRPTNREIPVALGTARGEALEAAPPSYTEQVGAETTGALRNERGSANESASGRNSETSREESPSEPGTVTQGDQEPGRSSTLPENTRTAEPGPIAAQNITESEDRGGTQHVQVMLDPEITETIRRMAQEQRRIRAEIQGCQQDTFDMSVLVKSQESRLGLVFKRIGDVIDDQWALREGMDELKQVWETRRPAQEPIKSERTSTNNSGNRGPPPRPIAMARSDIESLYASEENNREIVPGEPTEGPDVEGPQLDRRETPGEAWIRNRNQPHRFGLGTDEALERWQAASEASRQRRVQGQQGSQQRREEGVREGENPGNEDQRRSVTQPYEAGFGRRPNPSTPPQSEHRMSNRGYQRPGGGDSGSDSSNPNGQRSGDPDRRRRGSSHAGDGSRDRSSDRRRGRAGNQRTLGRRRRSPPHPSSSESSDDWDSEFTVLDDEDRRGREKKEHRRDPRTEYEREQLRRIRERIRKMVGQDIQYAATYKGVKDTVTVKYAGQNDNGIFTRWLDHLLMNFQLNRMCGPDNELVRLSAMYRTLEGVAEEWYRDLILHTPRRSWTFEKAVCSLFLTYVFGSAASHAAREFNEVKYSRTEGAREYAQRLKTKARRLARKPDESTMIVRFLAGLPSDVSRRLTLRERLDPMRHRFKNFVAKLHELEEAENVTKTVNAAVVEEQRKAGAPGPRKPNRPQFEGRNRPYKNERLQTQQQKPPKGKSDDRLVKGKGPVKDVVCFRCQGKGHYSSDPACPMFGKNGGPSRQLRDRPQLKAARVSEGEDDASAGENVLGDGDSAGGWEDGSQWESATEGENSLHSHDEAPQLNKMSVMDIMSASEEDDTVYVRAVRDRIVSIQKENPSRAAMHPKIDRPRRSKSYESCLATYVEINGMEAFTLFDSGSSADAISPDFAQVSNTRVYTLDKPVPLQLGTVGSRASINYGVRTSIELGGRKEDKYYLDVVNIDRYDAILGAPFMRKFGIQLDFNSNSIAVGGMAISALLPDEEAALLKSRGACRIYQKDRRGSQD